MLDPATWTAHALLFGNHMHTPFCNRQAQGVRPRCQAPPRTARPETAGRSLPLHRAGQHITRSVLDTGCSVLGAHWYAAVWRHSRNSYHQGANTAHKCVVVCSPQGRIGIAHPTPAQVTSGNLTGPSAPKTQPHTENPTCRHCVHIKLRCLDGHARSGGLCKQAQPICVV